ncbi:winged helix-turn-helix transcriptional regulator [Streptomyces sp. NBC_01429]|uniref:winged helix-turn-helix transcriptional regulator n=1 Tax=Streptomyces sp. NBC_01429 TaxID=2903862 RepID=UPI002E29D50F|nr:winged helix-turn-helix transcriptional regulator [Streptomyces sp. NBC_01429]
MLGRRWTLRILWELSHAPAGFRELRRRCERMSSSVLSTRLGELADARVLALRADGCHLTRLGRDLVDALGPLDAFRSAGCRGPSTRPGSATTRRSRTCRPR